MEDRNMNFKVKRLGEYRISSPISTIRFVGENDQVLYYGNLEKIEQLLKSVERIPALEKSGLREKIYFDPSELKWGIVTCGGHMSWP